MQDVAQSVDDSKGKKVLDWLSAAFFFQPLSPVMLQLCLPAAPCTDNRPRHSGTMYDILVRWLNCLLLCCALEVSSDVRKPFFKRMEKKKNFLKRKVAQLCTKEIVMHRDCKWIAKNFWNTFQCDAKCLWMKVCSSVMSVVGLFLPVLSFLLCCFFSLFFFLRFSCHQWLLTSHYKRWFKRGGRMLFSSVGGLCALCWNESVSDRSASNTP